jgi:CHAD domain-containing protein
LAVFGESTKSSARPLRKPGGDGVRASLETAAAALIQEEAEKLARRLQEKRSLLDPRKTHKLRINVKRLRYLLEPFEKSRQDCAAVLEELKKIQYQLGELHDGNVFAEEVAAAAEASAGRAAHSLFDLSGHGSKGTAPFWPERQGLQAIVREIQAERETLLEDFQKGWFGRKAEPLIEALEGLARSLSRRVSSGARGPAPKARSPRPPAADLQTTAGRPRLSSSRA